MQDLISRIVENVGIDSSVAESAVASILEMLQNNATSDQLDTLMDAIPGARDLLQSGAADTGSSAGGGLGGMLSGVVGALGGGNPLMDTFAKLQGSGLDMEQAKGVGTEVVAFAKEKAGNEVVDDVLNSVPGLSNLL